MSHKWFLLAGSAQATKQMIEYAYKAVDRAIEKGYLVLVGDNPGGVDLAVLKRIYERQYPHFSIVHLQGEEPRAFAALNQQPVAPSTGTYEQYHERDQVMVDMADACMFIWNGKSKGTRAGYDYAVEQGKECWLADFAQKDRKTNRKPLIVAHNTVTTAALTQVVLPAPDRQEKRNNAPLSQLRLPLSC